VKVEVDEESPILFSAHEMILLYFMLKMLKVSVITRPNVVKNLIVWTFCQHRTLSGDSLN